MNQRMKISEAAKATGLSEYTLQMGCKRGKYPHISIGAGTQKRILIDIDLLEAFLQKEAIGNVTYKSEPETINYGQLRKIQE